MKAITFRKAVPFAALSIASVGVTLLAVRARAAGIPDADVLTYTGYLENPDGTPLTGKHAISVRFLAAADATKALCGADSSDTDLLSGRFQVPLPDCTEIVKANPNLFVDVQVDGAWLGPTKLGAVPYAVEAGRAMVASDADGALETRLKALETRLGPRSVVRAHLTATQAIADQVPITKLKLSEDVDENGEFDPNTSTFTPAAAGNYFLQCTMRFETNAPGVVSWFSGSLLVNGSPVQENAFYGDGWTASRSPSGVFNLAKGVAVTCGSDQQASGGAARNVIAATFVAFGLGAPDAK